MDNSNFDIETLKKLLRKDIMPVNIIKKISQPIVKIEKVEDYYNFFVAMLRTEDSALYNKEHLWILGIDKNGYTTCAYLVAYGDELSFDYSPHHLLRISLIQNCEKIVLASYKNTTKKIEITNDDLIFASYVYRRAEVVKVELFDYIIISSFYDEIIKCPKQPDWQSLKEAHFMDSVVSRAALDMERIELEQDAVKENRIEIAVNLLLNNVDINIIAASTRLTVSEVERIKNAIT